MSLLCVSLASTNTISLDLSLCLLSVCRAEKVFHSDLGARVPGAPTVLNKDTHLRRYGPLGLVLEMPAGNAGEAQDHLTTKWGEEECEGGDESAHHLDCKLLFHPPVGQIYTTEEFTHFGNTMPWYPAYNGTGAGWGNRVWAGEDNSPEDGGQGRAVVNAKFVPVDVQKQFGREFALARNAYTRSLDRGIIASRDAILVPGGGSVEVEWIIGTAAPWIGVCSAACTSFKLRYVGLAVGGLGLDYDSECC